MLRVRLCLGVWLACLVIPGTAGSGFRKPTTDYTENTDKKQKREQNGSGAGWAIGSYPCYLCNPWFFPLPSSPFV